MDVSGVATMAGNNDALLRTLGQIEGRLHGIEKNHQSSTESRALLHKDMADLKKELQALSLLDQRLSHMERTVCHGLKPVAEDYKRMKNRGWGVLIAAALAGGGVAQGIEKLLSKLG